MKKRILIVALALMLLVSIAVPALATSMYAPGGRVVDNAELLTSTERRELTKLLDEISQRHQADVVVVTTDSLLGKTPRAFADDFYDENGYGYGPNYDGVLLLVSMEDRDWYISTCGFGITAFTDAGIEYISEQFLSDLSNGWYADAFTVFAQQCDAFLTQARAGDPYDVHNLPKEPFSFVFWAVVSLVIGLVVALIYTAILKGQLKTVRPRWEASEYVRQGSLDITTAHELFLYRNVTRRAKPKDSGSGGSRTHRSSSGRSHGGGGGKF